MNQQGDFDESYILNLTYMNFKDDVNQGLVSDVKISEELFNTIPQKYINSLYINNKLYQSDQYETTFLYNIEDNQYYIIVSFGMDIDYNGNVEDYLQREIIEIYYPESNYKITYDSKTSSYNIGNDYYSIERMMMDSYL